MDTTQLIIIILIIIVAGILIYQLYSQGYLTKLMGMFKKTEAPVAPVNTAPVQTMPEQIPVQEPAQPPVQQPIPQQFRPVRKFRRY